MSISAAFNKASLTYDQHAHTQIAAGNALIQKIISIKKYFPHVLDAGCGTGLTTRKLAASIQYDTFTGIDTAESLLHLALQSSSHINYQLLDFNHIEALAAYDLIFSNMALHWSSSLSDTFSILQNALRAKGLLAFTNPLEGTFAEIAGRFSTHSFYNLDAITNLLVKKGFKILHHHEALFTESFNDTLSALRSIKLTGANYVHKRQKNSLHGKSHLAQFNCHELSYVIGFFIAEKVYE